MVTREHIQRLIHYLPTGKGVLSLYLDMSVDSNNKRHYNLFLNQQRALFAELSSDREHHHREPVGKAFERLQEWIDSEFVQANRGIAAFIELGGDWFNVIQLPVPLRNRFSIGERPVIGPLAELVSKKRRYGIALADRENLRVLTYGVGELRTRREQHPEAYPTPHDVHKGAYAAKDYQKFKAEETRQFFRTFAHEIAEVDRREACDYWILLGTDENIAQFREFLGKAIDERVIHCAHASVDASDTDLLERLAPFFAEHALQDEATKVDLLRDRVRNRHFAITGVGNTLEQLQEGKVDTLVIARDLQTHGAQCTHCGFYLDRRSGECPYCGGELRDGIDLVESMIRIAAEQEVALAFVDAGPMGELQGVGALLKF